MIGKVIKWEQLNYEGTVFQFTYGPFIFQVNTPCPTISIYMPDACFLPKSLINNKERVLVRIFERNLGQVSWKSFNETVERFLKTVYGTDC